MAKALIPEIIEEPATFAGGVNELRRIMRTSETLVTHRLQAALDRFVDHTVARLNDMEYPSAETVGGQ